MAKPPTPQGISSLLKRAGFARSEKRSTRIKGWTESSQGYRVTRYREDGVAVHHEPGFARGAAAQVREHEKLTAYAKAIEEAGWKVQRDQVGFSTSLIVTAQPAEEATNG